MTSEGLGRLADEAGTQEQAVRELAALLAGGADAERGDGEAGGREVVVLWGERLTAGPRGAEAARALLEIADALGMARTPGAGLLEVPAFANGRGLREAGVLPSAQAGLQAPPAGGRDAGTIAEGLAAGDLAALYLLHCDPLRDLAHGELWRRALARATTVVAHASFLTEGIREHATVVFPAEAYAEKDGTVVHPDGRVQRLRAAIERPHGVRAEWTLLAELAAMLGFELGVERESAASQLLYESVPFYAGLTAEEIGGRGVRWQERPAAASYPAASSSLRDPAPRASRTCRR